MIYESEIRPNVPAPVVDRSGAEISIRESRFPTPFRIGLEYGSPARGTWTIAHSPMLIPETHEIYVCCSCCLHGVILSADEVEDGAGRFSMVTLTNENIIKGNLEEMMIEGVADIIDDLPYRPRCVECFTSCMQHFLHIDIRYVYEQLRMRFPDIDFIDGYMIPTLQRKFSPDVLGRRQLTRALQPSEKTRSVSIAVNYYPLDPASELAHMFRSGGYELHDFADCSVYEDYKKLAESEAVLYFLAASEPAAKDMARRLDQEAVYVPYSYSYQTIRRQLTMLAERFGLPIPDLEELEQQTEERVEQLSRLAGNMSVAIDYSATPALLSLARFLLEHGFHVYAVYADAYHEDEREDYEFLKEHYPDLLFRAVEHFKMRLLPRNDHETMGPVLAIGQKAAYFTGTDRFVNLIENGDEKGQLTGFTGIQRLMDLMEEAIRVPKDTEAIVQVKAWGCKG